MINATASLVQRSMHQVAVVLCFCVFVYAPVTSEEEKHTRTGKLNLTEIARQNRTEEVTDQWSTETRTW